MKKVLSVLLISIGISGCATPVTVLTNSATGQVARCGGGIGGSIGGGLIGYSVEKSNDENCVRDYLGRGFKSNP